MACNRVNIPPQPEQETTFTVGWVKWLRKLMDAVKTIACDWTLPVYTMDTLPTTQEVGDIAYATDGWNHGEQGYNEDGAFVVSNGTSWLTPYHRHYRTIGISINPASIASNASLDIALSTTGGIDTGFGWVSVGNTVLATPSFAINAGIIWCAFISAEDEITLRLHNSSGGAIDIGD
jgi:hypothetical protein